jgi:hypothetical protein
MTACLDRSAVTIAGTPPPWPIPDLNLLHNFSFAEGTSGWTVSGPALAIANSRLPRDTGYLQPGGSGLHYLAIDCGTGCPSLSQDVSLPASPTFSHVVFAATVRSRMFPAPYG